MVEGKKSLVKQEWLSEDEYRYKPLYEDVAENLNYLAKTLGDSFDLINRKLILQNDHQELKIGISVMEGLSDSLFVNQTILDNINENFKNIKTKKKKEEMFAYFESTLLTFSNVATEETFGGLINHLLNGDTIILIDGVDRFIAISSKGFNERAIEQPTNDISVKGSKESFTESLSTNVSLIRRRIKNPNLWIINKIIGKKSNCNIAILYMKGLIDEELIKEVERRLSNADMESVVDSAYLKAYLKEDTYSVFPLIYDTERPDSVVGNLFEGRFAILVDGSPFALIAPCTFFHFTSSIEDYYNKSFIGSALRIMRMIALYLALFLPAFYMCIVKHSSELLPVNLMYSITGQRANVPLPADLEIFLTLFAFDLLTEAGTRMPRAVGTALSFVGAIVIGQAAVEANLISSMMLIVVALNGIGTLLIPHYDMALTIKFMRYLILLITLMFGLVGFTISTVMLLVHLISLRSFGKPYLYPLAPLTGAGMLDSYIIAPLGMLLKRKKNQKGKNHEKN